ncbi:hypothetical protein Daus18300_004584 [Diaporthe australafricana]|uniref:Peptidase S8/S53 domain-containing protein n=1 Tax=Diaporthe australafricana TaxID=127596 RepID=A0ABR3X8K8_9PEZI
MKHLHENDALTPDHPGRGGRRSGDNTRSPSPLAPQDGDTSAAGRVSPAIPYRIKTPGQVLHDAISLGDLDRVKRIIEASPECVDARNERGRTSLHVVAQSGRNDIVKLLISKGADINARSGWKYTPLAFAANSVRPDVVMTLLEAGADMELPSNDGCTPLHFAALKKEKKAHNSILILLIKGANSNALNKKGLTALQSALSEGRYLNVQTLCAFGADPAFKNPDGKDAFHYAESLDSDLKKQLASTLSKWESPGKQTRKIIPELSVFIREGGELDIGEMLFWASRHGHVSLVECILELFAEEKPSIVEYENPTKGWKSLHRAAWAGQSKAVKVLLAHGATIDARTPGQQSTPLHLAADKGRQRTVKALVDHGADILAKSRQDATAFWLAAAGRHVKTLEVLLQHSLRIEDFEQHQAALDHYKRARDHLAELEAGEKSKQDVGGAATPGGGPSTRNDSTTIRLDSQSPDAEPVTPVPSFVPALQKISYSIRKNVTGIEIFDDIAGGQGTVAMSRDFLYNRLQTFLNSYLHTIPEFQRDSSPTKASRKVRICVIDTGLDKTHPSVMAAVMDDRLRAEKTFKDNGGTDTNDEHGHGTHMMELILHVAPEADIYVAKIADARFIPEKDFHLIAKESFPIYSRGIYF